MTRWAAGGVALVVLALAAGCADYVGDDVRAGGATIPSGAEELFAEGTTTTTTPPAPVDPRTLADGSCFDDEGEPTSSSALAAGGRVVPRTCVAEHRYQLYARADLGAAEAPWPGAEQVAEDADGACATRFGEFVGRPWAQSTLDYLVLAPDEAAWAAGERAAACVLFDLGLVPLDRPMAGADR